jgi:acyl dehydratase
MTAGDVSLDVGATVPPLQRTIDLASMVAYAGATWDWNRLHYDTAFLADRGLERPVVDGQMLGALLAEQAMDWLGGGAFPTRMSFRFRAMVFAGDTVRVEGVVVDVDREADTVTLGQQVLVGDAVAATGTTVVRRSPAS